MDNQCINTTHLEKTLASSRQTSAGKDKLTTGEAFSSMSPIPQVSFYYLYTKYYARDFKEVNGFTAEMRSNLLKSAR